MLIAVSQTISDASMKEQAPAGRCYDDPWGVAREVAACLRQQYRVWLEQQFPTALIEVDRVREGATAGQFPGQVRGEQSWARHHAGHPRRFRHQRG